MKETKSNINFTSNPSIYSTVRTPFFQKEGQERSDSMSTQAPPFFQPKLTIGQPNDKYEKEADAVADAVVNQTTTHVVPQNNKPSRTHQSSGNVPSIQRRLITSGTKANANAFLGLLEPPAGLSLVRNPKNNHVKIKSFSPKTPDSPTLRSRLTTIVNHPTQHAELFIGRNQPGVVVGAFPLPNDLTRGRVQRVDIDDILAIEAGAPGNGVALASHEIEENFQAHGVVPTPGVNQFPSAHEKAKTLAESPVAAELVGPGRRIAFVSVPGTILPGVFLPPLGAHIPGNILTIANTTANFIDYETYYLGMTNRVNPITQDHQVVNARRFPKRIITSQVVNNYVTGSFNIPLTGGSAFATIISAIIANPASTIQIKGFTDDVGSAVSNLKLSQKRANNAKSGLQMLGIEHFRIHAEGFGENNFVVPNTTSVNRGKNRRIEITVTIPQL